MYCICCCAWFCTVRFALVDTVARRVEQSQSRHTQKTKSISKLSPSYSQDTKQSKRVFFATKDERNASNILREEKKKDFCRWLVTRQREREREKYIPHIYGLPRVSGGFESLCLALFVEHQQKTESGKFSAFLSYTHDLGYSLALHDKYTGFISARARKAHGILIGRRSPLRWLVASVYRVFSFFAFIYTKVNLPFFFQLVEKIFNTFPWLWKNVKHQIVK